MKKLLIAIFTVCLFIPGANAYSATSVTALDLIPVETDMVMEFDLGDPNLLDSAVINMVTKKFENNQDETLTALIEQIFADNSLTLAYNSINKTKYILFECKASDFNALTQTSYTKTTYNNHTIATSTTEETYASFIKNYCVFTNTEQSIKNIIETAASGNYTGLKNYEPYQNYNVKKSADSFFSIFINPSITYIDLYGTTELISAIIGEGFAFSETTDGLKMNLYAQGDTNTLETLDYTFDKFNFVPKLYSKISGQKLIAYIGANNLSGALEDTLEILTQSSEGADMINEMYTEINANLGVDVKTEILPVLTGEWMIAVHDSGTEIPAFTAVFDVNANLTKAQTAAAFLNQKLKETFEKIETDEQSEFYSSSTKTVQGTTFMEHKFIDTNNNSADPFYLNIGVSGDGLFVISSHPNLSAIYKVDSGLTVNSGFKSYFTNPTESIREMFYFDIDVLKNYIAETMTKSGADTQSVTMFNEMFAPWHNVYSKLYATKNQEWGDILIKVDTDKITGVQEMMDSFMAKYMIEPVKFCDVNDADWFNPYVSDLSLTGVVEGYSDGCFKPGNEITRAEFIKMALMRKGYQGMYEYNGEKVFEDLKGDEWYAKYVAQAYSYGYIKGYEDGTFKPNDPITRAEALQIILNINYFNLDFMVRELPFKDVNETDWFYQAVNTAYTMGIVEGIDVDTFEPYRNLTRAEAAKMLYLGL